MYGWLDYHKTNGFVIVRCCQLRSRQVRCCLRNTCDSSNCLWPRFKNAASEPFFCSVLGYFLTWASVVGLIQRPPVPLMCLFMYLSTQSMPFFNTANMVSGVQNFQDYSGTIVGIMEVYLHI